MPKKTVLVTGGSRGIGKTIALEFAKNEYDVAITFCSNEVESRKTVSELKNLGSVSKAFKIDYTETRNIEPFFSEFDKSYNNLDVLINNAGWTKYIEHGNLDGLTEEIFDQIIAIDLKSIFFNIQKAVKRMHGEDKCIINISSIAAYNGIGSNIAYCAAKAGINSLTKSLAKVLAPNIRINSVAPGLTETEMTRQGPSSYFEEQKKSLL